MCRHFFGRHFVVCCRWRRVDPFLTWLGHVRDLVSRGVAHSPNVSFGVARIVSQCTSQPFDLMCFPASQGGSSCCLSATLAVRLMDGALSKWGRHLLGWPSGSPSAAVSVKCPQCGQRFKKAQEVKQERQQCPRTIKTKVRLMFIVQAPKTRSPSVLQLHFRHQFGSLPTHFGSYFIGSTIVRSSGFTFRATLVGVSAHGMSSSVPLLRFVYEKARLLTHLLQKACEDLLHVQNKCLAIRLSEWNP